MSSSKPNYLPKSPSPNTITLGVRASKYDDGGGGTIQFIELFFFFTLKKIEVNMSCFFSLAAWYFTA